MNISHIRTLAASLLLASALTACGNDSLPTNNPTSTTTTINGQAIAGAVNGTLHVHDANDNHFATATITNGTFSVEIPNQYLSGELDFEVTGTYRDEVSGQTVTLTPTNPLALHVAANTYQAGQLGNAPITPDTSIIRAMVVAGMTLTAAETAFKTSFGYKPDLNAAPFDPYAAMPNTANMADQTAAFRVGVWSQLGTDLGLTAADLAEIPNKVAADLADGTLDGIAGGNPVTFTSGVNLQNLNQVMPLANRVNMAVSGFAASPANVAGVAAPTMGLPPIMADMPGTTKTITLGNGTRQIQVKIDTPATPPFQMGYRNVKTKHKITLTDAATNLPVNINTDANINSISFKPWMYMFAGHQHGTPFGSIDSTQAASGIYIVDTYYLMPTAMMMGTDMMPMGQWDLEIKLGDNSAAVADPYAYSHFFPNVMMNMGTDLLLAKGVNAADTWTDMTGVTKPREYRVWLQDAAINGAGHDVSVYVTTLGMKMGVGMIFPPVYAGLMMPSIMTVTCEVSTDAGITWQAMPAGATNGQYSITSLTGLSNTTQNTLDIRLTVNGNVMTTVAGSNLQLKFIAL
jgi:hypothetical protein